MKKIFFMIIAVSLTFLSQEVQGQSIEPAVISPLGGYYSNSGATLSFTVAEMAMIQTFSAGNNILTQGFQQPWFTAITGDIIRESPSDISIYPNPCEGIFNLSFDHPNLSLLFIRIYNNAGQLIFSSNLTGDIGKEPITFDLSSCSAGIYLIQLLTKDQPEKMQESFHKLSITH